MPKPTKSNSYNEIKALLPKKPPAHTTAISENNVFKDVQIRILPKHTFLKAYENYKKLAARKPEIQEQNKIYTKKIAKYKENLANYRQELGQTTDQNIHMSLRGLMDSTALKIRYYKSKLRKNKKLLADLESCKSVIKANLAHHKTKAKKSKHRHEDHQNRTEETLTMKPF